MIYDLRFGAVVGRFVRRYSLTICAALLLAAMLSSGCAEVSEAGAGIAQAAGVITADEAKSITRGAQAVEKSWVDLTPEQEYYIGRAVAAQVFQTYPPLDQAQANDYLNLLGQSRRVTPETGYRFCWIPTRSTMPPRAG
jgi:hypothetical protein